jgi:hypothetical protein
VCELLFPHPNSRINISGTLLFKFGDDDIFDIGKIIGYGYIILYLEIFIMGSVGLEIFPTNSIYMDIYLTMSDDDYYSGVRGTTTVVV